MRRIILSFCLVAVAAGVARAQPVRPPRTEPAINAQLIRLHDDLRLSDSQETAWRDYTVAIAPSRDAEARRRATTELLPLVPTPRRIALIEAAMAQDDLDFRRQGEAVNAFYAKLTPDQQKTFDRDTLPTEGDPKP
jgi:hypothetical protein